jgi:hypothetical protein
MGEGPEEQISFAAVYRHQFGELEMGCEKRLVRFRPGWHGEEEAWQMVSVAIFVLHRLARSKEHLVFVGELQPIDRLEVEVAHFVGAIPVTPS